MPQLAGAAVGNTSYAQYVNPQWVRLLELLDMHVQYTLCEGAELCTSDGRRVLDFLSGYGVHNIGHNHPDVIAALKDTLDQHGPAMLQSHVPELAGELAARLCTLAGGGLRKVFFCSSGSEGIEAAIKFTRARTGRAGLLSAAGAFHGLTCGALSLMDTPFWTRGFGPLLPHVEQVPFGDLAALARALATRRFAAFVVEPVQAEAGLRLPEPDYFAAVQAMCRRYGTLLVLDEVQTGMFRTGPFLAAQHFGITPDLVILAKALSGGLVPCGAVLMTESVYDAVFGSLQRSVVHASTFSENALAMRAGLATLDVLEHEQLGQHATDLGAYLRQRLQEALDAYEMVQDVRGLGLLCGIAFQAPTPLRLRLQFEAFRTIHPAMFGQALVRRLFRGSGMLTQLCGNNFMVLKVAPPLVVTRAQIDEFVAAMQQAMAWIHSSGAFWSEALALTAHAFNL
jgi:ornithine--oxo-acid transaminase